MLNKVKLIGKVLPLKIKEIEEKKKSKIYFSLEVTNPSNAKTFLRCSATREEITERIKKELQEGDIVEVRGYLRNEKDWKKSIWEERKSYERELEKKKEEEGRQILIKVTEFTKLDLSFDKIDNKSSNQVRLIGKIITDFKTPEVRKNPGLLTFKIAVPREKNSSPLFFCRVQEEELVTKFDQHLKKGDIILLEGFLQAKKRETDEKEESDKSGDRPIWDSAIICVGFTYLDSDSVNNFSSLDKFTRIFKNPKEIDFAGKPNPKKRKRELTEE